MPCEATTSASGRSRFRVSGSSTRRPALSNESLENPASVALTNEQELNTSLPDGRHSTANMPLERGRNAEAVSVCTQRRGSRLHLTVSSNQNRCLWE